MPYLGNSLGVAFSSYKLIDSLTASFNGTTTSFALTVNGVTPVPFPLNEQNILISVGGVPQKPDSTGTEGFRFSGSNIVFSSAPKTGEAFWGVVLAGADRVNAGVQYPDGTASVPSITFASQTTTGLYRSGSGQIGVGINGSTPVAFSTSGVQLNGSTSGSVIIASPAVAGNNTLTLPTSNGSANQFLKNGATAGSLGYSSLIEDSSGRVGIGTTSPSVPFHVLTSTSNTPGLFEHSGSVDSYLYVKNSTGGAYIASRTNDLSFHTSAGATERARIDSSGRLLVGTSSGSSLITASAAYGTTAAVLNVNNTTSGNAYGIASSLQTAANNTSSFHFTGSTLAVGNWYLYGNGTSSWSSDERLKKDIQTTRNGYLEDVQKLRVVKYRWKNGSDQTELGLIAQEVGQVFPGLVQDDINPVSPDDPIRYKQLKGSVLPVILLKALQEAADKIEALEAKVAALEAA